MRQSKCPSRSAAPLTGADFRGLRERIKQTRDGGYSAARFAKDLGISESLLQFIETNHRRITPRVARKYRRVEREQIYCLKEDERADASTASWLVDALARHLPHLTARDKNRVRRMVK